MNNRIFKRIAASYLIICMIPVLTGLFAYHEAAQNAERQTMRVADGMLEHASNIISEIFTNVEKTADILSIDNDIRNMVSSDAVFYDPAANGRMYRARQALQNRKILNDNIYDIMLYCEKSDALIATSHIFLDFDRFYSNFFKYNDMTADECKAFMFDNAERGQCYPLAKVSICTGSDITKMNMNEYEAVAFTKSVRTLLGNGKIMTLVSRDALEYPFETIFDIYSGNVSIYNADGSQIIGLGSPSGLPQKSIEYFANADDKAHVTVNTAQGAVLLIAHEAPNGWHYIMEVRMDDVYGDLNVLKWSVLIMLGVEIMLLALLALFFARKSTKPVKALVELFENQEGAPPNVPDEYSYLRDMITLMKQNYQSASRRLDAQTSFLKKQLIMSRLRDDMPENVLRENFERAQLRYPEDGAAVALLRIDDNGGTDESTRENLTRMIIREKLTGISGQDIAYTIVDEYRCAIIFFDGADRARQERVIACIMDATAEADCTPPIISIAPPDGLHSLPQRYVRADIRLHRWDAEPGVIDWISQDTELRTIVVHYSVKTEERIIRYIKSGSPVELKGVLDKVVDQNGESQHNDHNVSDILTNAFRLTCVRAQREAQFTPASGEGDSLNVCAANAISSAAPLEDFYAWCMRAAEQIEHQRKTVGRSRAIEPVCQFLQANFTDKQLSLALVADKFGLSETYFSRLFKAQTGEAYSEYLEQLRIAYARQLLESGKSVENTADESGYNSVTVFRAAFKRICGVTPSEYRTDVRLKRDADE